MSFLPPLLSLLPLPPFRQQSRATQELSRRVRLFVTKELGLPVREQVFLLAVSGGADSLALLCLWLWLRPLWGHKVHVLHVNHALRPESGQEASAVRQLCQQWQVPCEVCLCDVASFAKEQGVGLEEAARHCRYAALEAGRRAVGAQWICTGHHAGDLQEDVIMRLLRGTGWPGLGGMVAVDEARHVLRPLLLQDPAALRHMLNEAGLGWIEDRSNADPRFLRNRVRHSILPLLRAENPAFEQRIVDLWHMARADTAHWDALLASLEPADHTKELHLEPALLLATDKATRLRLYMRAVRRLAHAGLRHKGQGGQARARTLLQLDAAWQEGRGNALFQLPGNLAAKVQQGGILFFRTMTQ